MAKRRVTGVTPSLLSTGAISTSLRPDRHRQRRDEDTARGRLQATGRVEAEPRMDVEHVARAVVYMATLPLDTNVQFMTVMATKMPYIGRG